MTALRSSGWLLAGALAGVLVPALDLWRPPARLLQRLAPLSWTGIGIGLGLFVCGAALHFRQRSVRGIVALRAQRRREEAVVRLVTEATRDGVRWLRVIQENLELVAEADPRPQEASLYLGGARSHADKLEQAFERIRGTVGSLVEQQPTAASSSS